MKVLVTGGAGFIGSHVVDALVEDGHAVLVVDALMPVAHAARPVYLNPAAEWIEGDLRDGAVAERAAAGVTAVCHQASMVGLGVDFADIADYVGHNDFATAVLLRRCRLRVRGPPRARQQHGRLRRGQLPLPAHGEVRPGPRAPRDLERAASSRRAPLRRARWRRDGREDAPLDPRNVYAATKVAQEHLCAAFSRETGIPVTALRYHNVYGPRMPRDTPYAGVASIFRSALEAGRRRACSRTAASAATSCTSRCRPRQRARAARPEPIPGAFNVAAAHRTPCSRWPRRSPTRSRGRRGRS